jgi:hypothetical protein
MIFYDVSALMEFLINGDVLGPSVIDFKVYYVQVSPPRGLPEG